MGTTTTGSSNANTSWNGQFFASSDKPYIRAMWLLSDSCFQDLEWDSVRVGLDIFKRNKPTENEIERKLAMLSASGHPL